MIPSDLPPLIQALKDPVRYHHPVGKIEIVQTHISWVILTGRFAYKIKKPVNFGFLDFTNLDRRHFFCREEIRLNQRLAPDLYLDVIPISGTPESPELNGSGPPIEYAVRMKEFPQEAQLDRVMARGELKPDHIDSLAQQLAEFHNQLPQAPPDSPYGTALRIAQPTRDNFQTIRKQITDSKEQSGVDRLESWTQQRHQALLPRFQERKRMGFIRECHGDAHLGNMAMIDDQVTIFDCIEFSENLRWIDVMSEIAFLTMDLEDRGYPHFSERVLNMYLELTGDYAGLNLLRFYQVYRALVRAKVACIRLEQEGLEPAERDRFDVEYRTYEALADRFSQPAPTWLAITHGFSGSGKSTVAQWLAEQLGAIRIRTDVERRRLFGRQETDRTGSSIEVGPYTKGATRQTYQKLADLATLILNAGFPVIADGTFLNREQRNLLRKVADSKGIPFIILDMKAPEALLRQRLVERQNAGQDVSEADVAVLEHQIKTGEPLDEAESRNILGIDAESKMPLNEILVTLKQIAKVK